MKTSITHPLQIAEIVPFLGSGRIGITFCPGKHQPGALSGWWARDLELDCDVIADWGAAAVVTLVTQQELTDLRVDGLGSAIRTRALMWAHLPIIDVSVPCERFEQEWTDTGASLRALLRGGASILVHCKGGLGRAGMIAARLLVELGWQAEAAIAAVREVRPGAIETLEQEAHVLTVRAL
jgi:ADP-ribosyl-[dinitrogen reductase] hydrolase